MHDSRRTQKLQKQALLVVYWNYNSAYTESRGKADVPMLYMSRVRNEMTDVLKILSQENRPKYLRKFCKECKHCYNTRNIWSLGRPKYRTVKYGLNCIKYHGVKLWNSRDSRIKCAMDLKSFKERIRSWDGKDCTCHPCVLKLKLNL